MEIAPNNVVTMHYTLRNPEGEVLDSSDGREPLAYLHGHGNIIPGLEKQLEGKAAGDSLEAHVPSKEAYGEHNPERVVEASRSQFPEDVELKPGMRFQAETQQGPQVAVVTEIEGDTVKVDTNHPLAGVDLKFSVDVVEVREATQEELDHGHVSEGDGGDEEDK